MQGCHISTKYYTHYHDQRTKKRCGQTFNCHTCGPKRQKATQNKNKLYTGIPRAVPYRQTGQVPSAQKRDRT